jgi:predicted DNA-binding transcriptional regulator YafY
MRAQRPVPQRLQTNLEVPYNAAAVRSTDFYKQDRVMRLLRVIALFQAKPHGLTTRELAERLEVTQRTAQRDLLHLQSELHVPFVQVGARWMIVGDFWLSPVVFNIHEAMAMLLSARLMLRFMDKDNAFASAAYEKVAAALPQPVRAPVMETAEMLSARRQDPDYLKVLTALTVAWAERRKVVITYTMANVFDRTVWPLFLEPNPTGHSCYLVAWDPRLRAARNYKVERISAVQVLDDRFDPPLGFAIGKHLAHAWSVWTSDHPVQVELVFAPAVARRVKETTWHESQEVTDLPNGAVRVRLLVAEPTELKHWVLGWGSVCEVVAPARFRDEVAQETAAMAATYAARDASTQVERSRAG